MIELSIVIPTFNERPNVRPLVDLLNQSLDGIAFEVIFVDDDSPDGTAEEVRQLNALFPHVRSLRRVGRHGLASACLEGMMAAQAQFIAVMDADLQHDEKILPEMLRRMRSEDLDLVVGSRNVEGGSMGEFSQDRVTLSGLGRSLSQLVCKVHLSDPMSGFFLVNRKFLDQVIYSVSGIGFKILLDLVASSSRSVRLAEIPYTFRNRQAGQSKLSALVLVEYLQLIIDKLTGSFLPARFLLFAGVGAVGVIVHFACLAVAHRGAGWDFFSAQLLATVVAMTFNFFLNNAVTYRDAKRRGPTQMLVGLLSFYAACSLGAWLAVQVSSSLSFLGLPWLAAGALGVAIASVWNFAMTQFLTWRTTHRNRMRRQSRLVSTVVSADARP